jgi:hypothetical protein
MYRFSIRAVRREWVGQSAGGFRHPCPPDTHDRTPDFPFVAKYFHRGRGSPYVIVDNKTLFGKSAGRRFRLVAATKALPIEPPPLARAAANTVLSVRARRDSAAGG